MYYFVYAFSYKNGIGYGSSVFDIEGKITPTVLDEVREYLYEHDKEVFTAEPIIINWKRLEEE